MNTPLWRNGLTLLTLVLACGGDDGAQLTSTSTTGPATEGMSSTSVGSSDGSSATSQASSSSEASTNEHTATETGCAFLDCTTTDGLPLECDIWENNCPDGYKCMPWANDGGSSWNAHKCSPIDPNPAKPGEPCTVEGNGVSGVDNCEAGAMCWNVEHETLMGTCIGFCEGSSESFSCPEPYTFCTISGNGVLILCLPGCDPLKQDCDDGDTCLWGGWSFICALDASGEQGQYGDPCEYANVCDPGLVCQNSEYVPGCMTDGCCTPWCDLTDPSCPGATQECLPWIEQGQAPPEYDTVGICGVPQ
jgi:hypothetical protein